MKFLKIRSSKKYLSSFKNFSYFLVLKPFFFKENDNVFFKNYLKSLKIIEFHYCKFNIKEIKRLFGNLGLKAGLSGDLRFLFFKNSQDYLIFIKSLDLTNLVFFPFIVFFSNRNLHLKYLYDFVKNNKLKNQNDFLIFFLTFKIGLFMRILVLLKLKQINKLNLFLQIKKNVNA